MDGRSSAATSSVASMVETSSADPVSGMSPPDPVLPSAHAASRTASARPSQRTSGPWTLERMIDSFSVAAA